MEYEFKPIYYNKDDFKTYTGVDLDLELQDDDNPSNKVDSFLARVENRMKVFLASSFNRNVDREFKFFSDYQKLHFKYALIEQALYVFKNGDLSILSGYRDGTIKASRKELKEITISDNAKNELILCGLWNRNVKNVGLRGVSWWYGY